jgi:hypothetical protein
LRADSQTVQTNKEVLAAHILNSGFLFLQRKCKRSLAVFQNRFVTRKEPKMRTQKRGAPFVAALFGAALIFGAGTAAHALSITYNDANGCGGSTCFGSVYTLNVDSGTASGGGTLYNVEYVVNTAGYTGGGSGLDAIAFKITDNTSNILSTSVTSQPGTFGSLTLGGLSAGGCASGPAGFICSSSSNIGGVPVPNGTYTFQYGVTLANGTLFGDTSQWTLKAQYVTSSGDSRGLTSATGGVPVPGTSLLFGIGMALFFGWHNRSGQKLVGGASAA